jgi:poly-gamma-glutamate synthesis protein (capsule biosynthesis protein)
VDVIGVGDAIFHRELSRLTLPGLHEISDFVKTADMAYVNFEMQTPSVPVVPNSIPIAMRPAAPPWTLNELENLGFDLFGLASNHCDDYGSAGLLDTVAAFTARGLTFAGSGSNLEQARMPAYRDTAAGRVALICATSSGAEHNLASNGAGVVGDRPGTNPLRYQTEYRLEAELFSDLRRIDEALGSAASTRFMVGLGMYPGLDATDDAIARVLGKKFVRSERSEIITTPHPHDVEQISRWIYEARRSADLVIVGLHSHEGAADGWNIAEAAGFIPIAARAFVDAGADVVFGHGPHRMRGIEIYKGKPIIYSLGNFLFQDEAFPIIDPEIYAMFNLGRDATPADFHDWRGEWPDGRKRGLHSEPAFWYSVIARCTFGPRGCEAVRLYPIDMRRDERRLIRGLPVFADGVMAHNILQELGEMCSTYGTTLEIVEDDPNRPVGLIKIA